MCRNATAMHDNGAQHWRSIVPDRDGQASLGSGMCVRRNGLLQQCVGTQRSGEALARTGSACSRERGSVSRRSVTGQREHCTRRCADGVLGQVP